MAFSVSRQQAVELAVLVSFAAFTVCCAGFFERNETGMAEQESAGMETLSSTWYIIVLSPSRIVAVLCGTTQF